jgi:hypothetical protein
VGRVRNAGIHRADFSTLGFFEPAYTFGALVGINDVDFLPFLYSLVLALWFTSAAAYTVGSDFICHSSKYLLLSE